MFKNILKILSLAAVMVFAMPVYAVTSLSISPATVSVNKGDVFVVTVSANASEKIGVGQVEMAFPADIVRVTNFSWVTPTNYDVPDNKIDNVNGKLLQVGGFPGGKDGALVLARITLTAVAEGTGSVSLLNGTDWFNKDNSDTVSALPNVLPVTVKAIVSAPAPVKTITPAEPEPEVTSTTAEEEPASSPVEEEVIATTTADLLATNTEEVSQTEGGGLLANVASFFTSMPGSLAGILILIAIGYVVIKRKKS